MMDKTKPTTRRRQRGSAMIEYTIVGPLLTLLGTLILQYSLMFNARNLINHASFMAGRAGSMTHADLGTIQAAYARALIPLYGGGRDTAELAEAYANASADLAGNAKVELLNPTKESFDDWNDADLQAKYGRRAIPNGGLAFKDPGDIRNNSGQNVQDANLIKLKITHGYELKVPLASTMMQFMMKWSDTGKDPAASRCMLTNSPVGAVICTSLPCASKVWRLPLAWPAGLRMYSLPSGLPDAARLSRRVPPPGRLLP
jgi:hypothetical protein